MTVCDKQSKDSLLNGGMTAVIKFKHVKKFLSCFFICIFNGKRAFYVGISSI